MNCVRTNFADALVDFMAVLFAAKPTPRLIGEGYHACVLKYFGVGVAWRLADAATHRGRWRGTFVALKWPKTMTTASTARTTDLNRSQK